MAMRTIVHDTLAYGLWSLVLVNSALFIVFALSDFTPKTSQARRAPWSAPSRHDASVIGVRLVTPLNQDGQHPQELARVDQWLAKERVGAGREEKALAIASHGVSRHDRDGHSARGWGRLEDPSQFQTIDVPPTVLRVPQRHIQNDGPGFWLARQPHGILGAPGDKDLVRASVFEQIPEVFRERLVVLDDDQSLQGCLRIVQIGSPRGIDSVTVVP